MKLIGHTDYSLRFHPQGVGEMANTEVLSDWLGVEAIDIYELFGVKEREELFELSQAVYLSAQLGKELPCDAYPHVKRALHKEKLVVLTYLSNLASLVGCGVEPDVARVHVFGEEEFLCPPIYEKVRVPITQNPLSSEVVVEQGIRRPLYVPYQLPAEVRNYRKKGRSGIVGCFGRLEYRKNVEFLVRAMKKLGHPLYLRGDLDPTGDLRMGEGYTEGLEPLLEQEWITWERERTSREALWEQMAQCDLGVFLWGTDDPPNAAIEMLAMGVPILMLRNSPMNCFEGLVEWTPNAGVTKQRLGAMLFNVPDEDALMKNLARCIANPPRVNVDRVWERFSPELGKRRLELALRGDRREIEALYQVDRRLMEE